jgi:hypothetical protein
MIVISSKYVHLPEFRYICNVIFEKWFGGSDVSFLESDIDGYQISTFDNMSLVFESPFFREIFDNGLTETLLELVNVRAIRIPANFKKKYGISEIPVIFHDKKEGGSFFDCSAFPEHFDVLGMCFFLLSRLEEFLAPRFDKFNRQPGAGSIAYENGFLYTPIVDIYLNIFIQYLNFRLGSRFISVKKYTANVTCDVDNPYLFSRSGVGMLKRAAADVILRHDIKSSIVTMSGAILPSRMSKTYDPFSKAVDYIMDLNEHSSNVVQFNFIPTVTDLRYDGDGGFPKEPVRSMLKKIKDRGHQIGIHPGFNTYNSSENMRKSVQTFHLMQNELFELEPISGRQHYLRWQTGVTESILNDSGIATDSTLSFADTGGFRCGTSKPFILFDLSARSETSVLEYPLIVMETTYFGKGYLNLRIDDVYAHMNEMKSWCKLMDGCFTILWHNSSLQIDSYKEIYEQIIKD